MILWFTLEKHTLLRSPPKLVKAAQISAQKVHSSSQLCCVSSKRNKVQSALGRYSNCTSVPRFEIASQGLFFRFILLREEFVTNVLTSAGFWKGKSIECSFYQPPSLPYITHDNHQRAGWRTHRKPAHRREHILKLFLFVCLEAAHQVLLCFEVVAGFLFLDSRDVVWDF